MTVDRDALDEAVYTAVHAGAMATKDIARAIGVSPQILINKANPNNEHHKLSLREALLLMQITGDRSILRALETELGEPLKTASPRDVLSAMLDTVREQGDVVRVTQESLADGTITAREEETIQREIDELQKSVDTLRASLHAVTTSQKQRAQLRVAI